MPSSHSGVVSALVTAVYLDQGITNLFAISLIFALVFNAGVDFFLVDEGSEGPVRYRGEFEHENKLNIITDRIKYFNSDFKIAT